jgi:hypothetical protein
MGDTGIEGVHEPLRIYRIVGWRGDIGVGGIGSEFFPYSGGPAVDMSAGNVHSRSDGTTIHIRSYRRQPQTRADTRAWIVVDLFLAASGRKESETVPGGQVEALLEEVRSGRIPSRAAIIVVDSEPVEFEVFRAVSGDWAAFAETAGQFIGMRSHGVPIEDLELVSEPFHQWARFVPDVRSVDARSRRFPDELREARPPAYSALTAIDLVRIDYETIEGSIAGQLAALQAEFGDRTRITGAVGESVVDVTWSASYGSSDITAGLYGTYGDRLVSIAGRFHHEGLFDYAVVEGVANGASLQARVERVSGGFGSSSTVAADGTYGEIPFSIYVADRNHMSIIARGTWGEDPIQLDFTRSSDLGQVRVTGTFPGPPDMAVLLAEAALTFM